MYRHVRIKTALGRDPDARGLGLTLDGGNNSIMVLSASVPAITADDLISMHWLVRARHESDRLSRWTGRPTTSAEVTMTLRTLKEIRRMTYRRQ